MSNPFKAGDKVRCIDSSTRGLVKYALTFGKTYEVLGEAGSQCIWVRDDNNEEIGPRVDRFELVTCPTSGQPPTKPAFDLLEAMLGASLKFRSGCAVKFVAYIRDAKPHCQLVLLNPATGNVVTRYATGKPTNEPHNEPGDILLA